MKSVADTEPEVDINRAIGSNAAHLAAHLHLGVGRKLCVLLNETLEVDAKTVKAYLGPRELWQSRALPILGASWVNPECHVRAQVHHGWRKIVQDGCHRAGVRYVAVCLGTNVPAL